MDRKRGIPLGPMDNWNCSQNSQSQKISVGIPVDSSAEAKGGFTTIFPSFQHKSKSSLGKSVVEDMMKELGSFLGGKKSGVANQGTSGWISPKNLDANKENEGFTTYNGVSLQSGGIKHKLLTSLTSGFKYTENRKEPASVTKSKMEFFDQGLDRRRLTLERKIEGGNAVEEFKFTAEQTTRVDRTRNHGNGNVASCGASEALRLKLFESLGTAPAQKDLGEDVPIDESIFLTGQIVDNEKQDNGKVKAATCGGIDTVQQKSDIMEIVHSRNDQTVKVPAGKNGTSNSKKSLQRNEDMKSGNTKLANFDSDYEPCRAVRTPVTRSASRKRSTRLSNLQNKAPESLLANSDKVGCQGGSFDFGKSKAPSGKTYISKKLGDILPAAEKIASRGSKKKFHVSPSNVCSTTPGNAGSPESFTPMLAARAHVETKFPKELLQEKTTLNKSFPGNGRSKSIELRSKASYCGNFRELYTESTKVKQDTKVPVQGLGDLSPPIEDKKERKQRPFTTPEDPDDESLKSFKGRSRLSSGTCTPQQSPHVLRNFRSDTSGRRRKSYNRSPSPKEHQNGDEDGDEDEDKDGDEDEDKEDDTADGHIMSGKNSEDPLSRAISQFAFVLERYKVKIRLHTGEKISEILATVANGIHSHLRAIESQISAEADKLSSHSKTKRKRLEIKFGEQTERLRVIHDKYKEEVYRLLDEYKTTLEELEAYHLEMKGNVDRQNASCRKILLQAEEGIYARLCEAERTIATIRNGARKKMRSLKTCLNEVF